MTSTPLSDIGSRPRLRLAVACLALAGLAVLVALAVLAGCAPKTRVLARVGNREITVTDFTDAAKTSAGMYPPIPDSAKVMLLRDLVQRQLMLEGANAAGYYRDTVFLDFKQRAEDQVLRQEVFNRLAGGPFPVTDAEIDATYHRRDQEVRARMIYCLTEEMAKAAADDLGRGTPFNAVADRFNVPGMLPRGGELGFVVPGTLVSQLDDQIANAPVGRVVGPIEIPSQGWFILEVEERRARKHPSVKEERRELEDVIQQRKTRNAALRAYEKLKLDYNVRLAPGAAQTMMQKLRANPMSGMPAPPLTTGDRAQVLATYSGGYLTLGDALTSLDQSPQRPNLSIVPAVERWIESQAVERAALVEARRRKLGDEPAIQRKIRAQLDNYLLNAFYESQVLRTVAVTEDDVRAAYVARASSFVDLQEAKLLTATFKDSASAATLAEHAGHTGGLREAVAAAGGAVRVRELTVHPAQDPFWQPLTATLARMEPKEYTGPIQTPQGWMLIQIVSKQMGTLPFEALPQVVQQSLRSTAMEMKREARLTALTDSLRQHVPVKENFAELRKVPWPAPPSAPPGGTKTLGGPGGPG